MIKDQFDILSAVAQSNVPVCTANSEVIEQLQSGGLIFGGKITDLHKGGKNCFHMFGISYYDKKTGELFSRYVEDVFNNKLGGKDHFWDDVLCHFYASESKIYIRKCSFSDTIEIDSFDELCEVDESYKMKN